MKNHRLTDRAIVAALLLTHVPGLAEELPMQPREAQRSPEITEDTADGR